MSNLTDAARAQARSQGRSYMVKPSQHGYKFDGAVVVAAARENRGQNATSGELFLFAQGAFEEWLARCEGVWPE